MDMRLLTRFVLIGLLALMLTGCKDKKDQIMDGDGMFQTFHYTQISQDEAKEMMTKDDGHVIVDVRREDEYAEGHIPGAILVPNESITDAPPEELPDREQIILVYCRSGRRSKEAAQKLADLGYSNVYEFGGIIDWTGKIERKEEIMDIEHEWNMDPVAYLNVVVGDRIFTVDLEDNPSAQAFKENLSKAPVTLKMHDYGSFEKVGDLPWELPRNDEKITTKPGDLILYQGNKLTVYYAENTWEFTKLGSLLAEEDEIVEAFGGKDDITAEFFLEWTE
jgi:rhodanese-related sulfurtransferase